MKTGSRGSSVAGPPSERPLATPPTPPAEPTGDPWEIADTPGPVVPAPRTAPARSVEATVSLCTEELGLGDAPLPFAPPPLDSRAAAGAGISDELERGNAGSTVALTADSIDRAGARPATPFDLSASAIAERARARGARAPERTVALEPDELTHDRDATARDRSVGAPFATAAAGSPAETSSVPGAPWDGARAARVTPPTAEQELTTDLGAADVDAVAASPVGRDAPSVETPSGCRAEAFPPLRQEPEPAASFVAEAPSPPAAPRPKPPTPAARIYASFARAIKKG